MAVSTLLTESIYTGNGVTTSFAPGFHVQSNTGIKVSVDAVVKTLTTDYTLTGSPATAVVFGVAPLAAAVVRVYRETPLTQTLDLADNTQTPEDDREKALDRIVMMLQELEARVEALEP